MGKRRKTKKAADVSHATEDDLSESTKSKLKAPPVSTTPTKTRQTFIEERSIKAGKEIFMIGRAWLSVQHGVVEVHGKRLSAGQKQLLTADAQMGGPVCISTPENCKSPASVSLSPVLACNQTFHIISKDDPRCKHTQATRDWLQVTKSIIGDASFSPDGRRVYAIVGNKNLGKSTFARLLVNSLLNQHPAVGFLDTDLGQPEFTVPGMVSMSVLREGDAITGPPYMHRRVPDRAYYMGDTTVEGDPLKMIQAVGELHRWWCQQPDDAFREDKSHSASSFGIAPLVLNTHGWIQGVGLEVLKGTLQIIQPTDLINLVSANPKKNLPEACFWAPAEYSATHSPRLHQVPGIQAPNQEGSQASGEEIKMQSPVDVRNLAWLEFASRCVDKPNLVSSTNPGLYPTLATKLASQAPFVCSLDNVQIEILHGSAKEDQLLAIANCAVVGLAKKPSSFGELAECIGMGVVRGVDAQAGCLYLLTDMDTELLDEVDILQVGKIRLPQLLMETQQIACPYASYWCISQTASGSGVLKSRNTLKRASHG